MESETDFAFEGILPLVWSRSYYSDEDCALFLLVAGEDANGNLTHSTDQRTGTTHFEYDKLGRSTKAGSELFAFDLRTISFQKNLKDKTGFVRDGSHLLQEIHSDGRYTYLNSYEPLAQVRGGQPTKEKADNEPTTSTRPHRLPKR
ncbi:RHS repeat domain-containing protein [Rothia aeria]|uniref:RHS repeat domain-containing protein n=1 Tax=Rothia aeria TaxID=172042 RepID=UPI00244840A7|nr:RHS repeat domain-containing protein [Rothia aeria]